MTATSPLRPTGEPLLVFPDPPPPLLAQTLDLAGYPWKAVANSSIATQAEPPDGWAGAVVCADDDTEGALGICRALRKRDSSLEPVLLLISGAELGELEMREDLFDDFCLSPFHQKELEARLRHLFWRTGRGARPEIVEYGDLVLNLETYQAALSNRPLDLTYMEYELLKFFATHSGKVFTREQLLSRVWGYEYYGGARTVDVHVRRLRAKLGEEHANLIQTVRSVGYRFGTQRWAGAAAVAVRDQHIARFAELLPEQVAHLDWTADELRREQDVRLRQLVRLAVERSPWHRERLAGIDTSTLTAADLSVLPVMTKSDLMDNFDDIVTDRRLTLDLCERHLDALHGDAYLLDEFHVVASGGSSGRRGVFVYGWDAWALCYSSIVRFPIRDRTQHPELADSPPVVATVAASSASHISAAIGSTFSTPDRPRHSIPVNQPIEHIVDRLNELQPTTLMGYSSFLLRLVTEARARRLRIAPQRVVAISEPLLPEARSDLEATWGVPVASGYGMSEGLTTGFCGHGSHLPDDLCLLETVSADGLPVEAGTTSAKVYVTNLYNTDVPLIRFEVTDEVTVLDGPCPCGSAFRRIADPLGRLDDTFVYTDGTAVHPHVFRSALGHQHLVEYQVRQTEHGADISVVTSGAVDTDALVSRIEGALRDLGLPAPVVTIAAVDRVDRQSSGKLKRFVPLGATTA